MRATCVTCGKIWTGSEVPGPVDSLLFSERGILAVGLRAEVENHPAWKDSRKVRLPEGMIVPGLSDCHVHLLAYAKQKLFADLSGVRNKAEMLDVLARRAKDAAPDAWVCGYNMNEVKWGASSMPDRRDLDSLGIPNPVLVQRNCTHATVLNSRALVLCSLEEKTSNEGVLLDERGEPSGILVEDVQAVAHSRMGRDMFGREKLLELIKVVLDECASFGFSTMYVCGVDSLGMEEPMDLYQALYEDGVLKTRIFAYHDTDTNPRMTSNFGNRWVNYQGYKIFIDGSLGARTAALSSPYSDAPSEKGMYLRETKELVALLRELDAIECQSLVHAIGDGALDQLLDALEEARRGVAKRHRLPLLVNHCMICRPDQVERMKKLGLAATVQPSYIRSDRDMAPARLGDRVERGWAYPWRSLVDAGIPLNGSSDCPIEPLNPWIGIHGAVTRDSGRDIWMPKQRLSVEEALRMYTVNPALTNGAATWRGRLERGKEADFAVLDRDIFACPAEELDQVTVLCNVVGGSTTWGDLEG